MGPGTDPHRNEVDKNIGGTLLQLRELLGWKVWEDFCFGLLNLGPFHEEKII